MTDFIKPCLATRVPGPPGSAEWVHEIKHDGYRLQAHKDGARVRLFTRGGHDWTARFPRIAEAVARLRATSCILDGEAAVTDPNGLAVFDLLRSGGGRKAVMFAFDLMELDGVDLRARPLLDRKAGLAKLLRKSAAIVYTEHLTGDGKIIFEHACGLGIEGIVSKRVDAPYRSGRSPAWLKTKNPEAPAVTRLLTENWK